MRKVIYLVMLAIMSVSFHSYAATTQNAGIVFKSISLYQNNYLNGDTLHGCFTLLNNGDNAVKSAEINFSVDNVLSVNQNFAADIAVSKTKFLSFDVPLKGLPVGLKQNLKITINKINDETNANKNDTTLTFNVASELYSRNVVVEEGTGLWCPWCVRGIVGMQTMHTTHPDDFIGIAVHNNDALTVSEYTQAQALSSYPSFIGDRTYLSSDASASTFESFYQFEKKNRALAKLDLNATWNTDSTGLNVNANATFGYTGAETYNYVLVLVEDSITGYKQKNEYAGGDHGEMGGFENMDAIVEISMNDVARCVYPSYTGQSFVSNVLQGTVYPFETTLALPSTLQSTKHLSLVALLLDNETGVVVNAKQMVLTGGKDIPSDSTNTGTTKPIVIDKGNGDSNGLKYVDMGLSVNWAFANMLDKDSNFGQATAPEICGGYFGWADPTGLLTSTEASDYLPSGNPTEISSSKYDIARTKWGGSWRLPTNDEVLELVNNCVATADTINHVAGIIFKSKINGATIFIPSNGSRNGGDVYDLGLYGAYWTGTRCMTDLGDGQIYLYELDFDAYGPSKNAVDVASTGMGIRPVFTKVTTTNINQLTTNRDYVTISERYLIDGRKIFAPQKGINILKLSNGKTIKVIIR